MSLDTIQEVDLCLRTMKVKWVLETCIVDTIRVLVNFWKMLTQDFTYVSFRLRSIF